MEKFEDINWEEFSPTPDSGELKKIRRCLRRRNWFIILTSVLLVAALAAAVFCVCIPMVESRYWDPTVHTYSEHISDLSFTLRAYSELFVPEYTVLSAEATKTGLATYDLSLLAVDYRNSNQYSYYSATLAKDELKVPDGLWEYCLLGSFVNDGTSGNYYTLPSTMQLLNTLPEYVKVRANVSFPEDLNMQEILELQGRLHLERFDSGDTIDWIAIRHCEEGEERYPLCGMKPLSNNFMFHVESTINDSYPHFYTSTYNKSILEKHFTSLLRYCADQAANGTGIVPRNHDLGSEYYQAVLDYVEENGIYAYGCTITTSADMLLKLRENGTITEIYILDIWIGF